MIVELRVIAAVLVILNQRGGCGSSSDFESERRLRQF